MKVGMTIVFLIQASSLTAPPCKIWGDQGAILRHVVFARAIVTATVIVKKVTFAIRGKVTIESHFAGLEEMEMRAVTTTVFPGNGWKTIPMVNLCRIWEAQGATLRHVASVRVIVMMTVTVKKGWFATKEMGCRQSCPVM